ncbi:MAG: hypothetical protein FJ190_03135 [Gammaproteobacteria bacterium]|nr:hypothetical protein [Gammaproteobacteria bacterium]
MSTDSSQFQIDPEKHPGVNKKEQELATESVPTRRNSDCPHPKPKEFGCRYIGKPCQYPVCVNGKWEYKDGNIKMVM